MPRSGPRRPIIGLRMADEQIEALDERAVAEDLLTKAGEPNRSELLRIMIEYAKERMPDGWRPEGWEYRG
ncbi:hypothetical protein DFR75_105413 [Nocardia ignorata]|uniref:Ribbon-helix-helix CopG family protein n=2 Tax=Nocardia ignorata TaxID=145285 RepID=A0A4R6P6V7_NOCIG|nr:hypothetical protein DFR75_105413 [Nocardia ignorata]